MWEADKIITIYIIVVNVDPDIEEYDEVIKCNSLFLDFFSSMKLVMSLCV
jgi:hypothetical protein